MIRIMKTASTALTVVALAGASAFACDPDPTCPPAAAPQGSCTIDDPGFTAIQKSEIQRVVDQLASQGGSVQWLTDGDAAGLDLSKLGLILGDGAVLGNAVGQPGGLTLMRQGGNVVIGGDGPQVYKRSSSVTVRSDSNGSIDVTVNGEPVPETRILRDDGKVKIIDEDGKVVLELETHDGRISLPYGKTFGLQLDGNHTVLPRGLFKGQGPAQETAKHGMIGITMVDVDSALAEHLGLEADAVVMVGQVLEGKPAAHAGVQTNDIITHVDGQANVTPESIRSIVQGKNDGDKVRLRVLRRGIPQDLVVPVEVVAAQNPSRHGLPGMSGLWSTYPEKDGAHEEIEERFRLLRKGDGSAGAWLLDPDHSGWIGGLTHDQLKKHLEDSGARWNFSAPGNSQSQPSNDDSIRRLEERLERLEKMLHELLERDKKAY